MRTLSQPTAEASVRVLTDSPLCFGCGTCSAVCPTAAVSMRPGRHGAYTPNVDMARCQQCGLCVQCCPALSGEALWQLGQEAIEAPLADYLGPYRGCYVAHATDEEVRLAGSSGGVVTALLCWARATGKIDSAVVVGDGTGLTPRPMLVRHMDEIRRATGSKYVTVPANVALREAVEEGGSFAAVGCGCHVAGVRLAARRLKKVRDGSVLSLGLFCAHASSPAGLAVFVERLGLRAREVERITYRGGGWPGRVRLHVRGGRELDVPYAAFWAPLFGGYFFTPSACALCADGAAEHADISFCDPWLPEFRGDALGRTLCLSRSSAGEDALRTAAADGAIILEPFDPERLYQSQTAPLRFHKRNLRARLALRRLLGRSVHTYYPPLPPPRLLDFLVGALVELNVALSRWGGGRWLLRRAPRPLLRAYQLAISAGMMVG